MLEAWYGFGLILGSGAFSLLCFAFWYGTALNEHFWIRVKNRWLGGQNGNGKTTSPHLAGIAINGAASFVVGLILMFCSDWLSDYNFPLIFSDEHGLKLGCIAERDEQEQLQLKPLGEKLKLANAFSDALDTNADSVLRSLRKGEEPSEDTFRKAARGVYYHAKNIVFREKTHFDELSQLQAIIEFVRSIALVSLVCFTLSLLCLFRHLRQLIAWFISRTLNLTRVSNNKKNGDWGTVVFFFLAVIVTRQMFTYFETQFNQRVFGYYISLHFADNGTRPGDEAETLTTRYSDVALIDEDWFLTIRDNKEGDPSPRLLLGSVTDGFIKRIELSVEDSSGMSDLEAVCPIPNREHEFLLFESSYYFLDRGAFIYHIKIANKGLGQWSAKVLSKQSLPEALRPSKDKDPERNQIEGAVSWEADSSGEVRVALGDRTHGYIYTGTINTHGEKIRIKWDEDFIDASSVCGDSDNSQTPQSLRLISSLAIRLSDGKKELWCSSSDDQGDAGPFQSSIRRIGQISDAKIELALGTVIQVPGLKVEGLAFDDQDFAIYVTDDENWQSVSRRFEIPAAK